MILSRRHFSCSDASLVALVSKGDEKAFRELLRRHQDVVYRFACRMLGDAHEAEDATQETFLRFYRASSRYRPEAALRTFLLRIAKNLCIDLFRKKRPEVMAEIPEAVTRETPLKLLERAIKMESLEKAIADLPVNQRAALLLRHTEHLPYSQIADVMGISVGAVESLLVRARHTLRRQLGAAI